MSPCPYRVGESKIDFEWDSPHERRTFQWVINLIKWTSEDVGIT